MASDGRGSAAPSGLSFAIGGCLPLEFPIKDVSGDHEATRLTEGFSLVDDEMFVGRTLGAAVIGASVLAFGLGGCWCSFIRFRIAFGLCGSSGA